MRDGKLKFVNSEYLPDLSVTAGLFVSVDNWKLLISSGLDLVPCVDDSRNLRGIME